MEILRERGWPEPLIKAIGGHAFYTNIPRETPMEKAILAADELTGFCGACALIRPSKKIADVPGRVGPQAPQGEVLRALRRPHVRHARRRGVGHCRSPSSSLSSSRRRSRSPTASASAARRRRISRTPPPRPSRPRREARRRGRKKREISANGSGRAPAELRVEAPFDGAGLFAFFAARALPGVERVEENSYERTFAQGGTRRDAAGHAPPPRPRSLPFTGNPSLGESR